MKLHNDGKGYSTITSVRGVIKPAFQMAYHEDIISRNPFDFRLVDVVPNDSRKCIAMTGEPECVSATTWYLSIKRYNDKININY